MGALGSLTTYTAVMIALLILSVVYLTLTGTIRFASERELRTVVHLIGMCIKHLGFFFNENWGYESTPGYKGTHRFHTFASVFDGLSNTMMLTENVKTGASLGANWASCDSRRTKVYFSNEVCKSNSCKVNDFDRNLANSKSQGVNGGIHAAEGMAPWPSSGHYGGINVSLADGSVRFFNENINFTTWRALGTRSAGEVVSE